MPKGLTPEKWLAIEIEWRTGAYSNVELANRHGVTEAAIRKRALAKGWTRDLGDAAELRAHRKLLDGEKPQPTPQPSAPEEDADPQEPAEPSEDSQHPNGEPPQVEETPKGKTPSEGSSLEPRKFEPPPKKQKKSKQFDEAVRTNFFGMMEEAILEQMADRRATENLASLHRADDLKRVRNLYLNLIMEVMSGDDEKVAKAGPILLMGRGDSLGGAIKALAAVDESLQKVIRVALGMDREAKRIQVSGPDGGPIRTENKGTLDVSSLSTEQLAALAAVNIALDGAEKKKGVPMPPGEPDE